MKIIKLPMDGYDAQFYKTTRYTTMCINLLFELDYTKENMFLCELLSEYMYNTNKKYKTKKELHDKCMEYYSMNFLPNTYNVGQKMFFECRYVFFDPKLVHDNYLNDALYFAKDLLFELNETDGVLDKNTLDRIKINMVTATGDRLTDFGYRANAGFMNSIYPNTFATIDYVQDKEEYEKLLYSFTDKNIIDMFNKLINESFVGMTLLGNFTNADIDVIKKLFTFKNIKILDSNYDLFLPINDSEKYIKVSDSDAQESTLYMAFECKIKSKRDKYIYEAIDMMLNYDSGRLLHKVLRDEAQIVYNASCRNYSRVGLFFVRASISRENEEKCINEIRKTIELLKDEKTVDELLKKVRITIEESDYVADENKWNVFGELLNKCYNFRYSRSRRKKIIDEITAKDIIKLVERIKEKVIYFYEGAANEK